MNDRLQALADQATEDILGVPILNQKLFAELIVRECISTLNEMHVWQSVNNQNYPSAWHDAVDAGIENIKDHFGVDHE